MPCARAGRGRVDPGLCRAACPVYGIVLVLLVLLAPVAVRAEPVVRVVGSAVSVPLVPRAVVFDPDGSLPPEEARRRLSSSGVTVEDSTVSHGYVPDTLWARIVVEVAPEAAGRWYLSLELPNFDRLQVFTLPDPDGDPVPFVELGDRVPEPTDILTRFHIAPIDLPPGRTVLLVRGRTGSTMTLDLKLRKLDALLIEERAFFALQSFYLGIAAIFALSALGLFAYTRHAIYLVYVVNLMAHTMLWLLINGTGPGYLWPTLARSVHLDPHPFIWLTVYGTGAFAADFLSTTRVPAVVCTALKVMAAAGLVLGVAGFFVPEDDIYWSHALVSTIALPILAALLGLTGIGLYRGEPAARPLMLTWLGLVAAVVFALLRDIGAIPNNTFTLSGAQLGSIFEMLVFACMLVERLGRLQREKEQIQREALASAREHEMVLERRVADRTAELDAANVRLRAIVSSAPFPLLLVREADGGVLYANQRACDLLGAPSDVIVGRPGRDWLVDPAARDTLLAVLDERGVVEDLEAELRRSDGTAFWALMSVVRIVYDGEPVRVVALNDITRRKDLEHDLRQTAELEAAAAERERSARRLQQQFVAMVSHEFRTPLAIIDGAAQNIEVSDTRSVGRLQKIRAAVRRLLSMIDACLVDERVDGGAIVLRRESVVLGGLLREAGDVIRAAAAGHTIMVELPEAPVVARADRRLTEIAVNNLLENAVKYSPPGTTVTVRLAPGPNGGAEVSVSDEGPGIPEPERARIFDKYYRAENTSGTAGAGLGLHLVRAIMGAHGGTVECASTGPAGSRFVLRFPGDDEAAAMAEVAE